MTHKDLEGLLIGCAQVSKILTKNRSLSLEMISRLDRNYVYRSKAPWETAVVQMCLSIFTKNRSQAADGLHAVC